MSGEDDLLLGSFDSSSKVEVVGLLKFLTGLGFVSGYDITWLTNVQYS